ncbi:restriction endonuclease [Pinirhizobacter soli]|uniref:restriction endonuclease n=1 Tax=Pinirhizobacter soli TaxID=2786953 RepID=UPI00202A9DF5|nr:restriction endonuclease [Pinirhizobacter soli]
MKKQMDKSRKAPSWEVYERLIARMIADQLETGLTVSPNAHVVGKITGVSRQVDVLIDARHDTDNTRRIVVDAKKRSRKVDINDVEAFQGLMADVGATHGYLVSPSGHTKGAEKRAQRTVSIRIVSLDHMENFDPSSWPQCKRKGCRNGRIFWDGYPLLTQTLRPLEASGELESLQVSFVHYVGKCDRCGRFHVWCLTCNDILSLPEADDADEGYQCGCKPPWFWLASVEEDEAGQRSAELHACLIDGRVETVDRRSL